MLILFDFKCPKGHVEEHLVDRDSESPVRCSCGEVAVRVINGGRPILDPLSGDFPGATLKWARSHEQAAKKQSDE